MDFCSHRVSSSSSPPRLEVLAPELRNFLTLWFLETLALILAPRDPESPRSSNWTREGRPDAQRGPPDRGPNESVSPNEPIYETSILFTRILVSVSTDLYDRLHAKRYNRYLTWKWHRTEFEETKRFTTDCPRKNPQPSAAMHSRPSTLRPLRRPCLLFSRARGWPRTSAILANKVTGYLSEAVRCNHLPR